MNESICKICTFLPAVGEANAIFHFIFIIHRAWEEPFSHALYTFRPKNDLLTSIDQLPAPKRMPLSSKPEPGEGATKPRPEVRIADQIAIRSIVLGQSLSKGKGGGDSVAGQAAAESGAAEAPRRAPPPTPPPSIAGEE